MFKDWNNQSSSRHTLNADKFPKPVGMMRRIKWVFFNLLNNAFPNYVIHENHQIIKFSPLAKDVEKYWSILPRSTPSRILCDLFWLKLPWNNFKNSLGRLNILDIGCGVGIYFDRLKRYSGLDLSYTGLDVNNNISNICNQNYSFELINKFNVSLVRKHLKRGVNLIISIYSMEHILNDLEYFRSIHKAQLLEKKKILQIHIFPSAECLFYYFVHGIRQYTPRNVNKISSLYTGHANCFLVSLGGRLSHRYFLKENLSWRVQNQLGNQMEMKPYMHCNPSKTVNMKNILKRDHSFCSPHSLSYALIIDSREPNKRLNRKKLLKSLYN